MATRNMYPPNSDKSKREGGVSSLDAKTPTVTHKVIDKSKDRKTKKGTVESVLTSFFEEDVVSVKDTVTNNLKQNTVRTIYNMVEDTLSGIHGSILGVAGDLLLGENRSRSNSGYRSSLYEGRRNYAYNGSTKRVNDNSTRTYSGNRTGNGGSNSDFDSRDYVFPSRGAAEETLLYLQECIDEYGKASVAGFLSRAGLTSDWQANNIGWRVLDDGDARIRMSKDGWVICLPRPIDIRNV